MAKLNIALLDRDKSFMNSVADFLQKKDITVSCFSNPTMLTDWIQAYPGYLDVLLVAQEWAQQDYGPKIKKVIILALNDDVENDIPAIFKYQPGERLVESILRIIAHGGKKDFVQSRTKMLGVCSAGGGAGKTALAAAVCCAAVDKGINVLYLNLEEIPAGHIFQGPSKRNFSHILYALKNKAANLSYRIEQTRCVDEKTKVHFLSPPDSAQEFYELTSEELTQLLIEFKAVGYDFVVVDLPAGLGPRTAAAAEVSDCMMYIIEDSPIGWQKHGTFMKELALVNPVGFARNRLVTVVNKIKLAANWDLDFSPVFKVPQGADPFILGSEGIVFAPPRDMLTAASYIVDYVCNN